MFSFIFPVTHWLFSTVLFTLHVFVFFSNFFLVADIWSYTVVVSKDAWYNFSLLNWNLFVVADKVLYSQSYGFFRSHIQMWELDHKEGWAPKNWSIQTVVLEMTLESPLDCKEIKPVNPKGNQLWILTGRADSKADSLEHTLMLGKIEGKRRRGRQRMRWQDGITNSVDKSLSRLRDTVKDREAWHAAVHRVSKGQRWLSNWAVLPQTLLPSKMPHHLQQDFQCCTTGTHWSPIPNITIRALVLK